MTSSAESQMSLENLGNNISNMWPRQPVKRLVQPGSNPLPSAFVPPNQDSGPNFLLNNGPPDQNPAGKKLLPKKPAELTTSACSPPTLLDNLNTEEDWKLYADFPIDIASFDANDILIHNNDDNLENVWSMNDDLPRLIDEDSSSSQQLVCADPHEVEGHEVVVVEFEAAQVVAVEEEVVEFEASNVAPQVVAADVVTDDYFLTSNADSEMDLAEMADFDLVDNVMNDTVPEDDLIRMIDDFTGMQEMDVMMIDAEVSFPENVGLPVGTDDPEPLPVPVVDPPKRGRGRPRLNKEFPIIQTSFKRRGRPPRTASTDIPRSSSGDCDDDQYLRMRHLNNIASQRCRANRRAKMETAEKEMERLADENAALKKRAKDLEDEVVKWRHLLIVRGLKGFIPKFKK
jgi:hypothetical protein